MDYDINHGKLSPENLQGIGQAEVTNKTPLHVLSRIVYKEPKIWTSFLSLTLWVYRTSRCISTQARHFPLIHGSRC